MSYDPNRSFTSAISQCFEVQWTLLFAGSFQVNGVVPQANGDSSKVKVKVRININGLFNVSGATITEKVENPPAAEEQEPMDVDSGNGKTPDTATTDQQQAPSDGSNETQKEASPVNDVADVEPANKDAADKVCRESNPPWNCGSPWIHVLQICVLELARYFEMVIHYVLAVVRII